MLPAWITTLPFRLGTTSYIIPDDILPNVRYLCRHVRDIELLLFELDEGLNNLPDGETLEELQRIGRDNDLSYTIHMPLDLNLGAASPDWVQTLRKAQRAIEATRSLSPWAYVLHLDGIDLRQYLNPAEPTMLSNSVSNWRAKAVQALMIFSMWVENDSKLALENLDGYPPDFISPVLKQTAATRCVDIGHLWKDRVDPGAYLNACLDSTRVIHLHGIGDRDHQSLSHTQDDQIDAVLNILINAPFRGVVTIEVFSEGDLNSSLHAIQSSLRRLGL